MSPGNESVGARLRAAREEPRRPDGRPRWSREKWAIQLRRAAGPDAAVPSVKTLADMVKQWERGDHVPGPKYRPLYARITGRTEEDLFGPDDEVLTGVVGEEEPTNRRDALRLGLAAAVDPGIRRRAIQALELLDGERFGGVADGIGELVEHYASTVCALPPAEVYDELLEVRAYAGGALERAGSSPRLRDISLSTGWLSYLLAVAACDMGEHAAARVWCSDAERRSSQAEHPELAAWSLLTRAMIAWYQGQPRHSVTLAAQGQDVVPAGTVVHAKLASQEMRAAAMRGEADRMARARRHAAESISLLPSDIPEAGAFSIALGEDPPYTATSLLLVGRFQEAISATNRVIQTVYQPGARQRGEHPSGYARSLLILGLAQAGAGRLDDAVAAGHAALNGARPAWPTMVLAGRLDQVLAEDYAGAGQTADYHARYLDAAGHPAGGRPQISGPAKDRE